MKNKMKRFLGILLSFALVLSLMPDLMPGMSLTAYAETWDGNPYASLVNTTTQVTFNGKPWYIIADNSTAADAGTVTLLAADTSFGTMKFDSNNQSYEDSDIKTYLDSLTDTNGAFEDVKDAIEDAKLYLLSTEEANGLSDNVRNLSFDIETDAWWLRTCEYQDMSSYGGPTNLLVASVVYKGTVYENLAQADMMVLGVRPALKLDLSQVEFDSATKTFALPEPVTEYLLWVGGTQVTSANASDIPAANGTKSGTASYDAEHNILTLSDYSYIDTGYAWNAYTSAAIYANQDLTIALSGTNTIENTNSIEASYGVYVSGNLTIQGSGRLDAKSTSYYGVGICGYDGLTVTGGTVTATGAYQGIRINGNGSITGATVTATGGTGQGIFDYGTMTIEGGTVDATGGSYGIQANNITIKSGSTVTAVGGSDQYNYAIGGTVNNEIAGTGWTNVAGTEGKAAIAVNSNQNLTYKKVQFPTAPDPVASVTPSGGTATEYTDFAEAVTAWKNAGVGATLKLLADVTTSSGIIVNKGAYSSSMILDLNGYGIRYSGEGTDTYCSVIFITDDGNLKLTDSEPNRTHYITLDENGRGVSVADSVTPGDTCVEVTGGYLTGGLGYSVSGTTKGGGVFANGTFTMEGGTIIGNTASHASGDGQGGGVYVGVATFTMTGGTITRNRASTNGGGVFVNGSCISFKPSGSASITGNLKGAEKNNVELFGSGTYSKKITITSALSDSAQIGVTMASPGVFTEGGKAKDYAANFISDDTAYSVVPDGDELKLSSHEHNFIYAVEDGVTITATCTAEGCDINEGLTLTVSAPTGELVYDGTKTFAATLNDNFNTTAFPGTYNITYTKDNAAFEGTPIDAGAYIASVTVGEGDDAKTASVSYTVDKATPAVDNFNYTAPDELTYDGDEKNATVISDTGVIGMGNITVAYYSDAECNNEVDCPINAGTYYVGVTVEEGSNFKAVSTLIKSDSWKFTIEKATPGVGDFAYNEPSDLSYNGSEKTATVDPAFDVEGMGDITVAYYSDAECTDKVDYPTNVGTYYVGISVGDGDNYSEVSNVLHSNDWKFTITQADAPTVNTPTPAAVTYDPSKKLESVELPEGWAWTNKNTLPTVGNNGYAAEYIVPDDTNYDYTNVEGYNDQTHKVARTVTLIVNKAEVTAPTIESKTYNKQEQTATVENSTLYEVTTNAGGTKAGSYDVVLTLTDPDNYKWTDSDEAAKTLTFTITRATISEVVTPTLDAVTYDPAKKLEDVNLPDDWEWKDATIVPTVDKESYQAVLTVDDDNYDYTDVDGYDAQSHTVTMTVPLTVNKANAPDVTTPTLDAVTYDTSKKLADITLPNGWKWTDETTVPTVDNNGYEAAFTVDDTNYDYTSVEGYDSQTHTVTKTVKLTVNKAEVTAPTIASKAYNAQNQKATVPASNLYTVTANEGGTSIGDYNVVLTLTDTANYKWTDSEEAEKTLTFTITKGNAPDVVTPTLDAVTYDPAKKLADVTLPDGWEWTDKTIVPTVDNEGYQAVLTVDDDNYDYTGVDGYDAQTHTVTMTVLLTVNKAEAASATVSANNITYDGKEKPLVTVTGETTGGTLKFAVTSENQEPDDAAYTFDTTSIPTATEAGTYYVWYKVVGDDNHTDTKPVCIEVVIEEEKAPETSVVETVNMYRIYNPNSGEHFYTANVAEKDKLVKLGWRYEGIGWKAPVKSNTPVYRLYNKNAGDHQYTLSIKERDNLVSLGWIYEGIGWYSDDAETVPLYRQYNPNAKSGAHNFTVSKKENDWLVGLGWRGEGIGWYGVK
ncbi:MAG: hypothetical protein IJ763_10425 [Lachnospiraceae bacterium]|nr:hypothetical protein [Lachnospiraceae bacterium]